MHDPPNPPGPNRDTGTLLYGCMGFAADWSKNSLADMPASYRKERVSLAADILACCFEHGIQTFDHADIYGCGKSEEIFAAAVQELKIPREQYILQSKCGIVLPDTVKESPHYDFSAAHIIRQVDSSLARLGTDYLDMLLLHRPDALAEPEEVAQAFTRLQGQGKVLAFGVSNHSGAQMALLRASLPFPPACNQVQISLLHHQLLSSGLEYNTPNPVSPYFDAADYCRLNGIRLQAWSPVARGKLFRKPGSDKAKTQLQAALEQMAAQKSCSPGALALAWLLRHPAGIRPIIGTTKAKRLADYCTAGTIRLSKPEWYQLLVAAREKNLP
ncbi:aldo/keto reductase [Candidatus Haliotispira prima]|uniref:Aldo/keto reductase n=1 Tax=Candidatus Haliotispira prima TaxID=3034016 RepID=A0ABY8MF58_9SPIO|nr:aldo/keto reductase [Candidatus Haliotispira prima]